MKSEKVEVVKSGVKSSVVDLPDIWQAKTVRIRMRDKLCGTIPKNPETLLKYVSVVTGSAATEEDVAEFADRLAGEVEAEATAEPAVTTFKRDEHGLYMEDRQFKAMLKECGTILGYMGKVPNPGRQRFQHGLFAGPPRIRLMRDGKALTAVDGQDITPGSVMGPQGPRSIVQVKEYVEKVELTFTVRWAAKVPRAIDWEQHLLPILALAQENGMGAMRSQSHGRFDVVEILD